tara:strand:+ start:733 stop:1155 length:423 start_codon:yes stop_codon:yes gene_type:complete
MNGYKEFLKKELNNFVGNFPQYINNLPNFFDLLCKLTEEEISKETKREIYAALAYFVLPNDVISEEIYGPAGYIDDLFVCCLVLKKIEIKYGVDMLEKYWNGDGQIKKVLKLCYTETLKELEDQKLVEAVLKETTLERIK